MNSTKQNINKKKRYKNILQRHTNTQTWFFNLYQHGNHPYHMEKQIKKKIKKKTNRDKIMYLEVNRRVCR